jgi:hypothetical protein
MMNDSAYITEQIASIAYVTGEVCGMKRLIERLAAAKEKVMFAPHWWHFVAVEPTSVPQAGQSRGRDTLGSEWNIAASWLRQRSIL